MSRIRVRSYDRLGILLFTAFAGWTVASAANRGGDPAPTVLLVLATAGAYILGRLAGARIPLLTAGLTAIVVLGAAVSGGWHAVSGGALAPPLGYGNADGALYALGVAAAAMVSIVARALVLRAGFGLLALVLLGLTAVTRSVTATVLAIGIVVAALTARWLGRRVTVLAAVAVVAAVAATAVVGLAYGSPALEPVERVVTERRAVLWHDAVQITIREPVFGIGPRGFAVQSPTAIGDADALWAHSAYLQTAAETGIPGAALLAALLLWSYGALRRSAAEPRLVAIGTAAGTSFAVHAAVDYVAHFPAVVLAAGLLVGLAGGPPMSASISRRR
jgi:O-antigen ligase